MAEEHDKTHRLLFGFPRMIEDLIKLCLPGPWIDHLDFQTLEQVSERFVDADRDMKRREADLVWRLRYRSSLDSGAYDWFYVYVNLEHMSTPRKFMALDTGGYQIGAWKQIVRHDKDQLHDGKLPPILSIVFYNGDREWRPKMLSDLVKPVPNAPDGLELGTFVLVDAQRWTVTQVETPLEALLKLEQVESIGDIKTATRQTRKAVAGHQELSEAFVALLNNVVFPKLTIEDQAPLKISTLEETTMLEQRIEKIAQGLILQGEALGLEKGEALGLEKGEALGLEKGKEMGMKKGEEALFFELYAVKYGEVPEEVREQALVADRETLKTWAKRLLTTERPEDVFKD